ncbi:ATPase inhibitor [Sporothrix bragantina]|uniref:ATPase inhibitor, mitochondrial n=1 Tax=Sporothrix bragantina TaxID=671064 RepID=A0ABP0CLG2_9PEZI
MLRQFTAAARPATLRTAATRTFATSAIRMAEGDTGAPRPGGDAFTRREKAAEDYAIRQREKEKLLQLRQKLKEQQAHLDQLAQHIDDLTKEQGGEKN